MSNIKVLAFGPIAEITGSNIFMLSADDTDSLKDLLNHKFPSLENKKFLLTVNKQLAVSNTILEGDAEVALLPPFSGG